MNGISLLEHDFLNFLHFWNSLVSTRRWSLDNLKFLYSWESFRNSLSRFHRRYKIWVRKKVSKFWKYLKMKLNSVAWISFKNGNGTHSEHGGYIAGWWHQFRFRYQILLKKEVIKRLIIHQRTNFGRPVKSLMIEKLDNCVTKNF